MPVKASLFAREFSSITKELSEMFGKQVGLCNPR